MYIHDKTATVVRPVKELKGFKKFMLNPGESKLVEFILTEAELGFYNNAGESVVEAGDFDVMVGTSSARGAYRKIFNKVEKYRNRKIY